MKNFQMACVALTAFGLMISVKFGNCDPKLKTWVVWLESSFTSVDLHAKRILAAYDFEIEGSVAFEEFNAVLVRGVNPQKMKDYLANPLIYAIEENIDLDISQYQPFGAESQLDMVNKFKVKPFIPTFGEKEARKGTKCKQQKISDRLWFLNRVSRKESVTNFNDMSYFYNEDRDGSGINVYVFDSGINVKHVEFEGRARFGYTTNNIVGERRTEDLLGHGTHVAALIAGKTVGIAKHANLVAIKVANKDGKATLFSILDGIRFSIQDMKSNTDPGRRLGAVALVTVVGGHYSKILDGAVTDATKVGLIFVVAAGNGRIDACGSTANLKDAITVGALTPMDTQAVFSNYGKCLNMFAPGHDMISAYIDDTQDDVYSTSTGTSQAAALVAGAVAKELEAVTQDMKDPTEARDTVINSATPNNLKLLRQAPGSPNRLLFTSCDSDGFEAANAMASDVQRVRKVVVRSNGAPGLADCFGVLVLIALVASLFFYKLDLSHMI